MYQPEKDEDMVSRPFKKSFTLHISIQCMFHNQHESLQFVDFNFLLFIHYTLSTLLAKNRTNFLELCHSFVAGCYFTALGIVNSGKRRRITNLAPATVVINNGYNMSLGLYYPPVGELSSLSLPLSAGGTVKD